MNIERVCLYTGHDSIEKGGKPISVELLFDEFISSPREIITGFDLDNTITRDDLGTQVFLEKLSRQEFWDFSEKDFQDLLLPNKPSPGNVSSYRKLVRSIIDGRINPEDETIRSKAHLLYTLFQILSKNYSILRANPHDGASQNQFSRGMIQFDQIVMQLESYFANFFGNQIFSRTRFLAGKSHQVSKDLTKSVIDKGKVQFNEPLVEILKELKIRGAKNYIVSTNLFSIVRELVRTSILNEIFEESDVIATKLIANHVADTPLRQVELSRNIEGEPVFGPRKRELLRQKEVSGRKLKLAVGDSSTNDGPMMAESLRKGGAALIVVPEKTNDIAVIADKFEKRISMLLGNPVSDETKQRMWYLESRDFIPAKPHDFDLDSSK